jgi:predicted Zn-ribbon and HTH transcriptional regulator
MAGSSGLASGLWEAFLNYLYSSGNVKVPSDFHERCGKIEEMLDNDISGIISTLVDYSINSSSEAILKVECSEETLEKLFNLWLSRINLNINGVPTGLQELAKEYYKERWASSSLCLMRVSNWETISIGNTSIKVPTLLYFVNGASIYIDRKNEKNFKLGTDEYYLDEAKKNKIPKNDKEQIIVQKPFARWFSKYPSPYLVKKGILKNWLAMEILASKGDEAVSKVLPYLFQITKGTENMYLQDKGNYTDEELKTLLDNFKSAVERYKNEKGKLPANAIPFDQKYDHLIPDLLPILREELYRQGYRALMSGLGFVDLIEIAQSRQETRLNPRPFIAEINSGVSDFKSMLMDVIQLIITENKLDHRKLFSDSKYLKITSTQLKINVQIILDQLRSAFIYGAISYETYHEALQVDHECETQRAKKEWDEGLREIYYPRVIQNTEDKGIDTNISPAPKITKKQEEKQKEKETNPTTMTKSEIEENLETKQIAKCKKCGYEFDYLSIPEAGMGWVKCPQCEEAVTQDDVIIAPYDKDNPPAFLKKYPKGAQEVFIEVFNKSLPKGEDYAYPVAWTALKRWLKKHGYKKVNDKWVKSEEETK